MLEKTDRQKFVLQLLTVLLLPYRAAQKIDTVMWFHVYLCANCTLASCLCVCLCGMEKRVTLFLW